MLQESSAQAESGIAAAEEISQLVGTRPLCVTNVDQGA